ncbi:hypothetical protein FQR65_LT01934 [Abscondita terminalis]|nr:hypothetical protein FQR65_LT01934 [Abscondita terminalis]
MVLHTDTSMVPLQYLLTCAGSFSILQSGLNSGWSSYALPQLLRNNSAIPLTNNEGSWVASTFIFGIIFGSLLTGLTVDFFGRRTMLLASSLMLFCVWLIIAYAKTSWDLYLARFIAGISDGLIFPCFSMYLAEVCNFKNRGLLLSGTIIALYLGALLANILGAFLSIAQAAFSSASLALVPFFLYLLVPESPQFYVIKKKNEKASITLEKFNKKGNVDNLINSIRNTLIEQQANKKSWLQLFTDKSDWKTLAIMVGLAFFSQFSGILGIIFYMETIFESASKDINPIILISIFYLLQILASFANTFLIDRVGRRPLLLTATCLVTVGLLCVTIYFWLENTGHKNSNIYSWLAIFGLFTFIVGYSIGLFTVPIVLCSEVFALDFKSCALTIVNLAFSLVGTAIPKFFQYAKDEYGTYAPFLTFTISSACGIVFISLFVPETKRMTLEEIQNNLRSKQSLLSKTDHKVTQIVVAK